jgi:protein translocase SecG subunit
MDSLLSILPYIQIALAVILIGAILMQQRGAGLGGAFGGGEGTVHYERRGFEKTLFKGTIVVAILFVAASALPLFVAPTTNVVIPTTDESPVLDNISIETNDGEVTTVDSESITVDSEPSTENTAETPAN